MKDWKVFRHGERSGAKWRERKVREIWLPIVEDEEEKRYSRSRDSTGTTKGHIYIAIFLALAFARIVNHCFVSKGFFPSNSFLWDRLDKMRHINNTNVQPGIFIELGQRQILG
ncbi:hypothetical protein JHK84_051321 [Glycine max]|nr:hypothetical protein JHK85_052156 [Glycine max]KAG5095733.1 hypothetical protein JHK84_051321 [Glycine max]